MSNPFNIREASALYWEDLHNKLSDITIKEIGSGEYELLEIETYQAERKLRYMTRIAIRYLQMNREEAKKAISDIALDKMHKALSTITHSEQSNEEIEEEALFRRACGEYPKNLDELIQRVKESNSINLNMENAIIESAPEPNSYRNFLIRIAKRAYEL